MAKEVHLNDGSNNQVFYDNWKLANMSFDKKAKITNQLRADTFRLNFSYHYFSVKIHWFSALNCTYCFPYHPFNTSLQVTDLLGSCRSSNFREFRANSTRAKHKTTGTIITSSNYASSNNAIGSLMQFRCVLACVSYAAHANNPSLLVTVKLSI